MLCARLRLVLTLVVSGALYGSPAYSDTPTIIACQGSLVTNSTGTKDSTDYYKITQGTFQEWNDSKSTWDDNICSRKDYLCSIGNKTYGVEGKFVSDTKQHVRHTISIDRTTGKVEEFWIVKYGESMFFEGDCKKSADPALNAAPTKF